MSLLDARPGQHVRIVGSLGTPSQRSAIWVLGPRSTHGIATAEIYRLDKPDCIVRWQWSDLEPVNPLKMLAEQAE
jgi:hypothetical protein